MKEHQHVEWKEVWRDDLMRCLCGFANAEGGVLVVGRNDKGEAVGVADARKLLGDLPNKVRDVLGIMADVHLVKKSKQELIEIRVEPYPTPISYKGSYYYRSGSTTQELKGAALERFMMRKRGRHWDDAPEPSLTVRSLSGAALKLFKQRARESGRMDRAVLRDSREILLGNLELTEKHGIRRAACLLFTDRPEKYVSGAWIKIGFFVTDDDLRYQDEVHGNLFAQVDGTLKLLHFKYLKAYITYHGIHRHETFLFPYEGMREALLNAIIHKDYGSNIPIQISVYDDRIVFWNPGMLPENWTIKKFLGKHPSVPFNPFIAGAFFRAGYIEAWGRGIEKINRECREHGIEPTVYEIEPTGVMVTFHANPAHIQAAGKYFPATTTPQDLAQEGLGEKLGERLGKKLSERLAKLGETRAAIVEFMRRDATISTVALAEKLGLSATAVDKNIQYLKSHGRIRRVGPARGGHWEVL
ncbi:MAG: transcriptional regulator [Planctomycetes bacterium]|nr:transcriptional regulator [Planctomycetota bacterium]